MTGCHLNSAPIHDLHRRLVILRVKSKQALKSYTGLVPSIYTGAVLCNMFDDQLFLQPKIVPHCDPTISQRRKLFLFLQRVQHMEPRQERAHSVTHSCKGIVIYGLLILSLCNNVVSCIFYATSKEICR